MLLVELGARGEVAVERIATPVPRRLTELRGTLEEILFGPGRQSDGTLNLVGALRRAMATTGYSDLKEFQRVEVVVSPYQPR